MKTKNSVIFSLAMLSLLAAGIVDILTPPKYILAPFYIIPILISAFSFGTRIISLITVLVVITFSLNARYTEHLDSYQILFQVIGYLIVGFLAVRFSIEKRRYEEIVNQLQLFMHMVSHDLAQPITAISLYAQNLEKKQDKGTKKSARKISNSLVSVQKLLFDLNDIAQARKGKFTIDPKTMALDKLILTIAAELQENTTKHKIVLNVKNKIIGNWDGYRLSQVVNNIIGNAIKYSAGGKIFVSAKKREKSVLLSVRDSGKGIAKGQQKILFQPFTRVSSDKKISGSGLGLYISRIIVESHQGKIWVENNKGKGCTFFVELPTVKDKNTNLV
jgi:signal transduction histidine kinase